jgi:hypothetical protein
MLLPPRPTSNLERQRQFRARNPGYDVRRKAARRAALKDAVAQYLAGLATAHEPLALSAPVEPIATPVRTAPLALPAPADLPVVPGMNALPLFIAVEPQRVPVHAAPIRPRAA